MVGWCTVVCESALSLNTQKVHPYNPCLFALLPQYHQIAVLVIGVCAYLAGREDCIEAQFLLRDLSGGCSM